MCADEYNRDDFDDAARSIAREVSEFVERAVENIDSDQIADTFGVDADRAREWVQSAGSWLSARVERLGDDVAARQREAQDRHAAYERQAEQDRRAAHDRRAADEPARPAAAADDPLSAAGPHPLDLPTDEQGAALAALDSGRWTVEPGSRTLAAVGAGPGPSDALGLVRELRVRDWIDADGAVTLAGRNALRRWLESATHV
jgi:hypothetical protein